MTTVNLNLSDELQQFLNNQVEAGQFNEPAEYIEALIRRAKSGKEKLDALLLEGLDSGDPVPLDAAEWNRIHHEVEQRLSHG